MEELRSRLENEIENTNKILTEVLVMVKNHDSYISDGKRWRLTVIGLSITMLVQVGGGLYLAGQLTERMENNTKLSARNEMRLDKHDEKFDGIIGDRRNNYRNNKAD